MVRLAGQGVAASQLDVYSLGGLLIKASKHAQACVKEQEQWFAAWAAS